MSAVNPCRAVIEVARNDQFKAIAAYRCGKVYCLEVIVGIADLAAFGPVAGFRKDCLFRRAVEQLMHIAGAGLESGRHRRTRKRTGTAGTGKETRGADLS
jgi:hypothetical protein